MVTKVMELEILPLQEVLKDYDGSEDVLEELLYKFRLWLKQQIHLPQDISDQRLKFYIFAAKFDIEKAKKRLDTLYTLHNLIPEFYGNLDPLSKDMELGHPYFQFFPLPKLTPEKYRVYMFRILNDFKVDIMIILRYIFLTLEVCIEEGIVIDFLVILDCSRVNIHHVMKFTPMLIKKIDSCLNAYGMRIKAIHCINAPVFLDIILKTTKSVVAAKVFNRIHIYTSGMESLYEIIPKSILPMEYGGEQPSTSTLADMWHTKLVEQRDWFLKEEQRKTNESLRTNSVINPQDLFGVSGTFRQLQID